MTQVTGRRAVRIANCSGFYGDRISAAREMLAGPIDVLTGDYLAELTMLILWKARQADPRLGYARTFLRQMEDVLGTCLERGVKIVANAGGLNPAGLAAELRELAGRLGLDARIAHITGDDLVARLPALAERGIDLANLDTGVPLAGAGLPVVTANAYLGGWGIAAALEAGADVVVCPRVTDASLACGPAAWWHGWRRDDWDALAGAVLAGHVIECGPQATGGNYSFLEEIADRRYPGFPIAEIAADGSSVITKHDGTGGLVSVGTVTAQLLYEIAEPAYLGPDVITHFDTVRVGQAGPDRVALTGTRGSPPPGSLKVALNMLGGYRNTMTLVITGLDIEQKAEHARQLLFTRLGGADAFDQADVRLLRFDRPDAPSQRAGHRAPAHHGQEPGRARGRPGVLRRGPGACPRRLCRVLRHDAADRGERVRRLLAGPGAGRGGHPDRAPPGRDVAGHPAHGRHDRRRPAPSGRGRRSGCSVRLAGAGVRARVGHRSGCSVRLAGVGVRACVGHRSAGPAVRRALG